MKRTGFQLRQLVALDYNRKHRCAFHCGSARHELALFRGYIRQAIAAHLRGDVEMRDYYKTIARTAHDVAIAFQTTVPHGYMGGLSGSYQSDRRFVWQIDPNGQVAA